MERRLNLIVAFFSFLFLISCAGQNFVRYEPQSAWGKYTKAGEEAFRLGKYAEAEKQFMAALKEQEIDSSPATIETMATSLNNLAWVYDATKKYADAEALRKRARVIEAELRTEFLAVNKLYIDPSVEMVPAEKGKEFHDALKNAASNSGFNIVASQNEADATLAVAGRVEMREYWDGVRTLSAIITLINSKKQWLWLFATAYESKPENRCSSNASDVVPCSRIILRDLRTSMLIASEKNKEYEVLEPARTAGFAIVRVFREPDKNEVDLSIILEGKEVARLPTNRYVSLALRPGKHRLTVRECKGSDLDLVLSPNQVVCVLTPKRPGSGRLELMDSREAAKRAVLLKSLEPLQPYLEPISQ